MGHPLGLQKNKFFFFFLFASVALIVSLHTSISNPATPGSVGSRAFRARSRFARTCRKVSAGAITYSHLFSTSRRRPHFPYPERGQSALRFSSRGVPQ